MQIFSSRPRLRWAAPLAFLAVVGGSGLVAVSASADDKLPQRSAEQLLVDVQQAEVEGLAGTVVQKADLGIPAIPGGAGGTSELTSLLSGTHTLRVWYGGPDRARLALNDTFGETDLIRNGDDLWTWSSEDNEATHRTLDADEQARPEGSAPADAPKTPQEAAERVLEAVGETTAVSTDSDEEVAGRSAYQLVLRPNDTRSLVSEVTIAVDGETKLPLRVQVQAGTRTVFEVGYTTVSFGPQDAEQFTFNPPPGAEVTEKATPERNAPNEAQREEARERAEAAEERTEVVGEGWTAVVVTELGDGADDPQDAQLAQFLSQLTPVSGAWGSGRLLQGTAFSAVLTDDGRLAVGAVAPDLLYAALDQ